MAKPIKSKLDQFAETLAGMEAEKKTLAEMQAWLKEEGCSVSVSTLSSYLESQRSARLQAKLLGQITSGAKQVREVEHQFSGHPAPELDTLIKLHRVAVLQLSTQAQADPELLKLVDQLTRTAMEYTSGQTKAKLEKEKLEIAERRVALLEQKAALFDQAKGIAGNPELDEQQKQLRMYQLFGVTPPASK